MPTSAQLNAECEEALAERPGIWESFRGARLLVTGGTGFVGRSLLELLLAANERFNFGVTVVLVTRAPGPFLANCPHLASDPAVVLQEGDVRTFAFPAGPFDFVIHAATDASRELNDGNPLRMTETIVDGTRRTLEFSAGSGVRQFLFVSSGAVYGPQRPDVMLAVEEEGARGGLDTVTPASRYGDGKRAAEQLCALYAERSGFAVKVARPFTFVGPYLPLDRHFAIGNFLRDSLAGRRIVVEGDGTTVRSYMYSSDMALWLLAVLIDGVPGRPYNVGSEEAVSIAELATLVAGRSQRPIEVEVRGRAMPGSRVDRYVPSTARARGELGLRLTVPIDEAIDRTLGWHRERGILASKESRL
jgi:nucleoside-diphosphate-sugar epimerase